MNIEKTISELVIEFEKMVPKKEKELIKLYREYIKKLINGVKYSSIPHDDKDVEEMLRYGLKRLKKMSIEEIKNTITIDESFEEIQNFSRKTLQKKEGDWMKMKEIKEKYLPIGTVVLLKNATKRIMITGFCSKERNNSNSKIYDYCGCLYPEGFITADKALLFDHSQIEKIYHIGLSNDDEEKKFKKNLKLAMEEYEKYNKTIDKDTTKKKKASDKTRNKKQTVNEKAANKQNKKTIHQEKTKVSKKKKTTKENTTRSKK